MATANHKLTTILKGRTISGTGSSGGEMTISFSDGSKMAVKTAPTSSSRGATGGKVAKVRQSVEPPVLYLDLEDGSSLEVPLAEATSSVMLRDKSGGMEYAD